MEKVENKEPVVLEVNGQKLFGVIHLPLHVKNAPAVLMCHGLAGNKTGRYRVYVKLAKELAKIGIASLRMDFEGCGDSDGEFSEVRVSDFLKDASTSLNYLSHHPQIDPNRIGVFGRSFGAAIALIAAEKYQHVKSLSLWAPLYNTDQWQKRWKLYHDSHTTDQEREQLLKIDGQLASLEFFKGFFQIDLEAHLKKLLSIPLLHIHGEKDDIIDIHHADLYMNQRKAADAPSKFVRLATGDHDFSHLHDQQKAIHETVKWFQDTL